MANNLSEYISCLGNLFYNSTDFNTDVRSVDIHGFGIILTKIKHTDLKRFDIKPNAVGDKFYKDNCLFINMGDGLLMIETNRISSLKNISYL